MSRCFPFPPPGYEKKHKPEVDLLKEEKHVEKKHNKEKKDKEKREGKDKKERDKSDGKHREKDRKEKRRDKKEKHRDKKKDKEKDRSKDKEKSSISEDASVAGHPGTRSVEKVYTREEGFKDKSHSSDEKKFTLLPQGQNGQNPIDNKLFTRDDEDSKFVQELGRRIRDEGKAMVSQPVKRFPSADCKGIPSAGCKGRQETGRFPVRGPQNLAEDKERNRESRVDDRKVDGQGLRVEARFGGNTMAQSLAAVTEIKVEGITGPVQKDIERSVEGKNKSKDRGDDKWGEKRKNKDRDKKSHGKDKGREKEKKKEEETKERTENKKNDQERSKELYRNEVTGCNNNNSSHLSANDDKNFTTVEILKKRKDVGTNGFLHENEIRLNKLPRPTSHQLTENGRVLEACQTPSLLASDKLGVASNFRVANKECRVKGTIEAPSLFVSKQNPPSLATRSDQLMEPLRRPPQTDPVEASRKLPLSDQVTKPSKKHRQADQIAEPSRKPPHPDLKYWTQVLSVPQMEEWSEVDDQEWLFGGKDPPPKKPEVGSSGDNKEPVAWSQALHIESVDIYALPYVIPY